MYINILHICISKVLNLYIILETKHYVYVHLPKEKERERERERAMSNI